MKKINFENADIISPAKVTVDGTDYTVTPAQLTVIEKYLSAETLNEMQSNIEESCVVVSPTEPTTNEKVWIQKGKNLINKSKTTGGYRLDSSGNNYATSGYSVTDFISVSPNTQYSVNYSLSTNKRMAFYDSNKTFISANTTDSTFITPSNACYLKLGVETSSLDTIQLEQGSTTEYKEYIDKKIYVNGEEFLDVEKTNNQQNYSTQEQVIGTWINGKPLYKKVLNFGNLPNNTNKTVSLGINNLKEIVKAEAIVKNEDQYIPLPYLGSDTYKISFYIESGSALISTGTDRTSATAYVIVEYTKTTD